jgi:UDP-N-acetylglucosamine 2-epimerase (non-hydrolysing)
MPEEINRLLTDQISDLLLTPSSDGDANLAREGIPRERVHLVGNVMIDSLLEHLPLARKRPILAQLGLQPRGYAVLTLHRPSNVDDAEVLRRLLGAVGELAAVKPMIFPVHPRTRKRIAEFGLVVPQGLRLVEPQGYVDFLALTDAAALVLTDSGGLQEETTVLGVPCLTLRENTERPVTVDVGTNLLVGMDPARIVGEGRKALSGQGKRGRIPDLWDGRTAARIADVIEMWGKARRGSL